MVSRICFITIILILIASPFGAVSAQSVSVTATLEDLPNIDAANQLFVQAIDTHSSQAWAVGYYRIPNGDDTTQTRSLAYFNDGNGWQIVTTPSPESNTGNVNVQLDDVKFGLDADNASAVGFYVANGAISPDTLMLEFDGTSWEHIVTPGQSTFGAQGFLFEAVHVDTDGNVYMGGQFENPAAGRPTATLIVKDDGGFDRYDGELISNSAHRFRDIDATHDSDVWLVGAAGGSAVAVGRVYAASFNGSSLQQNSPPNISFGENLNAVSVINDNDVWTSGVYQEIVQGSGSVVSIPLFWHWDGTSWTQFESPAFAVDLVAFNSNSIFGVGNDKLIHWDGNSWSVVHEFNEPLMALRSIAIRSATELVAVGENPFGSDPIVVNYEIGRIGDVNGDGIIDLLDVAPFIAAIQSGDYQPAADINQDGVVNLLDVEPFVALLTGN